MAWGRGLQDTQPGPVKHEGDGRAPAGAFAIARAFGYSDALPPLAKKFPYLVLGKSVYCVEDTRSKYYNQIVDLADGTLLGWEKRSVMRRPDGLFRWGLVVQQNDTDTKRGAGSCIFLHIWRGLGSGTAGCTAMPEEDIERLVTWIDPASEPVLVQLPELEYSRLREPWALP
jgi:D-alanyl-D-alanine dipeptidase